MVKKLGSFWVHILALGILALAFVEWKEYGVYTLVRFACCAAFVRLSWGASKVEDARWVWVWGIMAAAYNPFVPLSLGREIWVWVNLATIGTILFDVVRRSPNPLTAFKCISIVGVVLAMLFGVAVGGMRGYETLTKQWAEEADKEQELEEKERLAEEKKVGDRALLKELQRRQHLKEPQPPIDYSDYYPSRNRE